jgi:pimeloyl-ACP methyl ester carboxylesterase
VELPGLGQSPPSPPDQPYYEACADQLAALIDYLGYEQVSVLAYSTGTRAAETLLLRYPHLVERVVFLCPVYPEGGRAVYMQVVDFLDQRAPRWGDWMLRAGRLRAMVQILGFNGRGGAYLHDWLCEISTQSVAELKNTLRDIPPYKRHEVGLPDQRTLFIWGRYDLVQPRPRRLLPQDRLLDAAHNAPLFAARSIAREAIPFLLGVTDGREQQTYPAFRTRPFFFARPRPVRFLARRLAPIRMRRGRSG